MTVQKYLILIVGLVFFLSESPEAKALSAQAIEKHRFTCDWATAKQEQIHAIPRGLLKAISLAETGRWHKTDEESFAWPWTVTSGGPGKYFPTKSAAMREVRRLKAQGVSNIDVGCMQINLHFHGEHFDSLSAAFEPDINAAYAAKFLNRLHTSTGSWETAAGQYHSKTPDRHARYLAKVDRLWDKHLARSGEKADGLDKVSLREVPVTSVAGMTTEVSPATAFQASEERITNDEPKVVAIDHERTARLNARMASRSLSEQKIGANAKADQLALLRSGGAQTVEFDTAAAVNRARTIARQEQALRDRKISAKQERFANRRVAQLRNWRMKRAVQTELGF